MKKLFSSLPFRLLLGIFIGIGCGLVFGEGAMKVIVTLKYIMGQLITFCVPLIIIGFIAPSITKLGANASRLLGVAVALAYVSSIGAAFMSMGAGYAIIPHLSIDNSVEGLRALPAVVFQLDIPQIMSVMSALVLSILLGLAVTWTKSKHLASLLDEFQSIVLAIVSKVVIPVLPVYIATTFCSLSYEGMITRQLPAFLQIILIVLVGHYIWMALLYAVAGAYSGKNPIEVVKTGIGKSISAMSLLMGVGMFLQIMTLNGVRGYFVINALCLPNVWQYISIAVAMPIFGGVSAFGSASILGGPFVMALLGVADEIFVASALSLVAATGEFLPPTAMSANFSAQVVGEKKYSKITTAAIIPLALILVYALAFIILVAPYVA